MDGGSIVPKDALAFLKVIYNVYSNEKYVFIFSQYSSFEKYTLLKTKALVDKKSYTWIFNIALLAITIKVKNI